MDVAITLDQLPLFARQFWEYVKGTTVFLFYGEMGAGKTTLIEALCAAKGVNEVDQCSSCGSRDLGHFIEPRLGFWVRNTIVMSTTGHLISKKYR